MMPGFITSRSSRSGFCVFFSSLFLTRSATGVITLAFVFLCCELPKKKARDPKKHTHTRTVRRVRLAKMNFLGGWSTQSKNRTTHNTNESWQNIAKERYRSRHKCVAGLCVAGLDDSTVCRKLGAAWCVSCTVFWDLLEDKRLTSMVVHTSTRWSGIWQAFALYLE